MVEMETQGTPRGVIEYLEEQADEGNEIFTTYSDHGETIWIIVQHDLGKWVTLVSWLSGDEYSIMNVNTVAFDRLYKVMSEINDKEAE